MPTTNERWNDILPASICRSFMLREYFVKKLTYIIVFSICIFGSGRNSGLLDVEPFCRRAIFFLSFFFLPVVSTEIALGSKVRYPLIAIIIVEVCLWRRGYYY